jgi:hypothetical protein
MSHSVFHPEFPMQRYPLLPFAGLVLVGGMAFAQENPGQMGTTPQPSATDPSNPGAQKQRSQTQQTPQIQQAPTTPTQPQTRPSPANPPEVEKPESAVGGTAQQRPQSAALPGSEPNPNAGPLSPVQPNADELRKRIEVALRREPSLSNTNIILNISDNSIDITGNANTPKERLTARRIVQSFAGNRKVRERISVAGVTRKTDETLPAGTPVPPAPSGAAQRPEDQSQPDQSQQNRPKSDPEKHGDASGTPRE